MIIDTHCHLNMKEFANDLDEVISNAKKNNVEFLHTICTKLDEFDQIIEICEKYENIYGSVGVHPHHAKNLNIPSADEIINLSSHRKIISIGETGLDYYYPDQDINAQKKSFENHINASQETNLPVILHTRDAEEDTIGILTSEFKNQEFKGVIHCFTSSYELAKKTMDLGLYISISGIVTFKNATDLQDIVKKIPLDRILVETDAPYLAPTPMRGKRNEPAFTKYTLDFLSSLMNAPYEDIKNITTKNAKNLFSKARF